MTRRSAMIAGLLVSTMTAAQAQDVNQDRFLLHVTVGDASFDVPRFNAPSVTYFVSSEMKLRDDNILSARTPSADEVRSGYAYKDQLGDGDLIRTYAHISIDAGAYVVSDPRLLRIQLRSDDLGNPIERTIKLENRNVLAESFRLELSGILRGGDLSAEDFQRAYNAAVGAVEFNPILDNYLQVLRVLKANLRTAEPLAFAPGGLSDLNALSGFDALPFAQRWVVQLALLETLVGGPDLNRQIVPGLSVRDVSIEIATDMLSQLDFNNPDHGVLAVVRPYQILTFLHAGNDDCMSLSETTAAALDNAQAISMNWASQRTFLLDWGDCLERMTGFGDGRTLEQFVGDSAGDPFLSDQWLQFDARIIPRRSQLNASGGAVADRIKQLGEIAGQIIAQRNNQ